MLIHEEKIDSNFKGTIIDIETIGKFRREHKDSRQYQEIIPVIFGFINKDGLKIYCAKTNKSISKLKEQIKNILPTLEKPFYAFNSDFEKGALFHHLGEPIFFEEELNQRKFESKKSAVALLDIPQYDDPFNDNGLLCMEAWINGNIKDAVSHNRSCLLKERDILLKRGSRESPKLRLIK